MAQRAIFELDRIRKEEQAALVAAGGLESPQNPLNPQMPIPDPRLEVLSPRRESLGDEDPNAQPAQGLAAAAHYTCSRLRRAGLKTLKTRIRAHTCTTLINTCDTRAT